MRTEKEINETSEAAKKKLNGVYKGEQKAQALRNLECARLKMQLERVLDMQGDICDVLTRSYEFISDALRFDLMASRRGAPLPDSVVNVCLCSQTELREGHSERCYLRNKFIKISHTVANGREMGMSKKDWQKWCDKCETIRANCSCE